MKFKWTIYKKIQILILVILVVVYLISTLIIVQLIEQNSKNTFYEVIENTSMLLTENLEVLFHDISQALEYTQNEFIIDEYANDDIAKHLDFLTGSMESIICSYVAFDNGEYLMSPVLPLPATFDFRTRDWYIKAYGNEGMKWSIPYIDVTSHKLIITLSVYQEYDTIKSVIGLDVNLDLITKLLKSSKIGENGSVFLIDRKGKILSCSDKVKVDSIQNIDVELNKFLLDESIGIASHVETKKGLYYMKGLGQTNLWLAAFLPREELKERVDRVKLISTLVLVLALLFSLGISRVFTKYLLRPIEELKQTMANAVNMNKTSKQMQTASSEFADSEWQRQEQFIKTAELTYTDYLTGLPNRIKFEQIISQMIHAQERMALIYIDIDNFKLINDTYGHSHGDQVIKVLSKRFEEKIANHYLLSRLGGDEFGIIFPLGDKKNNIDYPSENILQLIREPIHIKKLEFEVTGSIGISLYPDNADSFEALLSYADIAMYEAKERGKNQCVIYNDQLKDEMIYKMNLETRLMQSIDKGEIYVYYQPLINSKSKEIDGYEALARWMERDMGMIFPDIFIPIAERSLFINQLGYFVLEESIRFGKEIKERFGRYYVMNVNVSAIQFHVEYFVDEVVGLLQKYEYPPGYLNLEITESVVLETDKSILKKLSLLRKIGIHISLDDFGTGYSSLNHLLNLSLTHLKIDRSLIIEAVKKDEVYRLIQGIVEFAHTIHLSVVAEGIEDTFMEQMVGEMKVDLYQGYLYSMPLSESDIIEFTKTYLSKQD